MTRLAFLLVVGVIIPALAVPAPAPAPGTADSKQTHHRGPFGLNLNWARRLATAQGWGASLTAATASMLGWGYLENTIHRAQEPSPPKDEPHGGRLQLGRPASMAPVPAVRKANEPDELSRWVTQQKGQLAEQQQRLRDQIQKSARQQRVSRLNPSQRTRYEHCLAETVDDVLGPDQIADICLAYGENPSATYTGVAKALRGRRLASEKSRQNRQNRHDFTTDAFRWAAQANEGFKRAASWHAVPKLAGPPPETMPMPAGSLSTWR
ncbi:MAG: hypothetical protein M1826_000152 [Phylliscum demangeonii]|nr:MAG: hypothetical protein M1826_000152 [Phylliscum demangeonii]